MDWEALANTLLQWTTNTGVKIVIALVIMFISFKIINILARRIVKRAEKNTQTKLFFKRLLTC